jgi:hypothetical protein
LRVPGTIEPIEIGFFVGDPFLDRLPGWFDGFHRLDVEGRRRRAWELDDAFHSSLKLRMACPQAVEAQKKFDLLGAFYGTGEFHGSFAAGALQRIGSPDFENHVAPEWAHGAGGLFRRGWDEENLGLEI